MITDEPSGGTYGHRPGQPVGRVLGFDNALTGKPVLPGFRLDLRELRAAAR